MLNERVLMASSLFAEVNWIAWRDQFEKPNGVQSLLQHPDDFEKFMNEYSLSRTIRSNKEAKNKLSPKENRQVVRLCLADIFRDNFDLRAARPATNNAVEWLGCELYDRLKAKSYISLPACKKRSFVSMCSKLLTFHDPQGIVPYDRFARRGVKFLCAAATTSKTSKNKYNFDWVLNKLGSLPYSGKYSEFLQDFFNTIPKHRDQLDNAVRQVRKDIGETNQNAFRNRIFDNYAMFVGGRWGRELAEIAILDFQRH